MSQAAPAPSAPAHINPAEYTLHSGREVFDEHDEHGKDGEVVRRFRKEHLESIAKRSNERTRRGALCPLTLGHTRDGADEKSQPEIVGYAQNFRVSYSADHGRHVLLADFYIRKDKEADAQTYPRVSVELWPKDGILDPIALLRRTPQRDLRQWTYAKGDDGFYLPAPGRWCYARGGKVIRYSMEDRMADEFDDKDKDRDPTEPPRSAKDKGDDDEGGDDLFDEGPGAGSGPPGMDELSDEEKRTADRFMKHYERNHPAMKYLCERHSKKYAAGSFPSSTNGAPPAPLPPGMPPDKEKQRMQRESNEIRSSHHDRDTARLEARLKKLEEENAKLKFERQRSSRERDLIQLEASGYKFDRAEELALVEKLTEEQYDLHIKSIRKNYKYERAPVGDLMHVFDGACEGENGEEFTEAHFEKANRYLKANPGADWEAAEKFARESR